MKRFAKHITGAALMTAILATSAQAQDQAGAAGNLAEISAISVQAKANLSAAALSGDVDQIAEMSKRSDAVDAAMAEAQEAYSAMEKAMEGGDTDAAQSAANDLSDSLKKASDALNGVIPEDVAAAAAAWKNSKKNTGGGPGKPWDPPNMYDVPWQSGSMRSFYQAHWGNLFASGRSTGDKEATPE